MCCWQQRQQQQQNNEIIIIYLCIYFMFHIGRLMSPCILLHKRSASDVGLGVCMCAPRCSCVWKLYISFLRAVSQTRISSLKFFVAHWNRVESNRLYVDVNVHAQIHQYVYGTRTEIFYTRNEHKQRTAIRKSYDINILLIQM